MMGAPWDREVISSWGIESTSLWTKLRLEGSVESGGGEGGGEGNEL